MKPTWRLRGYVWTVTALGAALLIFSLHSIPLKHLMGRQPAAFVAMTAFLVLAELRPIPWSRSGDRGDLTASWTFAFAILLLAPLGGALLATAFATLLGDVSQRKPVDRCAFNLGQVLLSLGGSAAVLQIFGEADRLSNGGQPTVMWMLAVLVAGATVFFLNGALCGVVLAIFEDAGVVTTVRSTLAVNVGHDGMLLALAPIFVVVSQRSLLLMPLLIGTVGAVYYSARLALMRQHDATHDQLTGLANRRLLLAAAKDILSVAEARGRAVALVLLDLDGFKEVNDRLGHHVGDALLQEVATRLQAQAEPGDIVARLGGDEFALLFPGVRDVEDALTRTRRIHRALSEQHVVQGFPLAISGSFGIAMFPEQGDDLETLLTEADTAMYEAKRGGKGVHLLAPHPVGHPTGGRLTLLGELEQAIDHEQFVLHFQPKADVRSGEIVGAEALVRWRHPRLGLVQPNDFITLAEQTELIVPLTEYVLRRAIRECAAWWASGHPIGVAVNCSARNLRDPRLPSVIHGLLSEHGLDPRALELEITENALMKDGNGTRDVLGRLRAMGVSLSIDDFGTGYSSLARLRDLSIDRVKIDRSFVTNMSRQQGDAVIVRSIIELARNLGLESVAEGVEDQDVWSLLLAMGCDEAQGFLLAPPVTALELRAILGRPSVVPAP